MKTEAPKTIAETRSRMHEVVRTFRAQTVGADATRREQLAERSRRAIERHRKRFQHKISDMLRRDAKRHRGINEEERLGLEEQLRLTTDGALQRLGAAVQEISPDTEPAPDPT